MKVEKTFCTTREAADLLGVSVGTIQLWVENGLLAAWKTPGGHRRVMRDSVEKLLRVKVSSPAPDIAVHAPETDVSRLKILVVEDDHVLLHLYRVMLAQWPMSPQVITIDNGIEALLVLERERPDLLITDLNMPGIDGFQVLRILKNNAALAGMAIVVVSGLDDADVAQRGGIPEGIQRLSKPIPFEKLLSIAVAAAQDKRNPSVKTTKG